MQTRRDFLRATGASAATLTLTGTSCMTMGRAEWRNRQSGMAYRRLGRTGFMISEVVMGGNEITPDNHEHVYLAMDMGLNYVDTAPAYGRGNSERGYARVLKSRPRDRLFLNSKVSLWDENRNKLFKEIFDSLPESEQSQLRRKASEQIEQRGAADPEYLGNYFGAQRGELEAATLSNVMEREYGRRIDRRRNHRQLILNSVDESLARLGTDHLDLLMCPHGASSAEELTNYPEIFEAFEELKRAGKVRHLGVSSHSDPAGVLEAAAASGRYDVAMVAFNVVNAAFMQRPLAKAAARGVGVIAMKVARPVHPGPNRGIGHAEGLRALEAEVRGNWKPPQRAYLWALRNPHLSAVISNMVTAEHVQDNVALPAARTS